MKWVVLAIIACVIPYTWITLKYRKEGPSYNPYEDSKNHANVVRLLEAGYTRINVTAERPADPQLLTKGMTSLADVTNAPGGLTEDLASTLVEVPELPLSFASVSAAKEAAAMLPYPVIFTCKLGDQKHQLGGAQLFRKDGSIVIVPIFEPLSGDLTARTKESVVVLTLPAGSLKSGNYNVVLAGRAESKTWTLDVK